MLLQQNTVDIKYNLENRFAQYSTHRHPTYSNNYFNIGDSNYYYFTILWNEYQYQYQYFDES